LNRSEIPKRIIEAGIFDGEIGPLSASELVAMPEAEWGNHPGVLDLRNKGVCFRLLRSGVSRPAEIAIVGSHA
jgi:hypothetical protein